MKNSNERIDFIADYLSSYQSKIQLLNSSGLFDAAQHYELFAQEICKIWFGKQFRNLNENTYTYPCVDLVADDNLIFVQVGTTNYIPTKITTTLKNIQKSKKPEVNSIKNVVFFMLDNASANSLKDKVVGNLTFTKATDLITPASILAKAKTDLAFQNSLYELLQKDIVLKNDFDKLKEAIKQSRFNIESMIDGKINNEYEIDRNEQVQSIIDNEGKNMVVLGLAGYGKSAICKKVVAKADNVLFARAEWIADKSRLDDIWGFNLKNVIGMINTPITIFIDSLEFIADSRDKYNLLPYLFEITKDLQNVRILMSCRTTDYNSFIKLKSFDITAFEVKEVTDAELLQVAKKYNVIERLSKLQEYEQLLKCPLYINLFVTKITDTTNINNENELRKYIWDKIICLNNNCKQIINAIAFERAKEFRLHVSEDKFDKTEIDRLVSENVLIRNGSFIRLKYDMFEDIVFERYFDEEFDKCKSDFSKFFTAIEILGRCVYRRYQIWIGNKLLGRDDRNNVLNKIVFSTTTPQGWKKETIIGLVRSRYSNTFFIENTETIIKNCIDEFIKTTNLYGFVVDNSFWLKFSPLVHLKPFGEGRPSLITIIHDKKLYESTEIASPELIKLLADFVKIPVDERDEEISKRSVVIIQYFLDKNLDIISKPYSMSTHKHYEYAIELLKSLYQLSEFATEWIEKYWDKIVEIYHGKNFTYAKDIIAHAIAFENCILAKTMPEKLCSLAEMYWTYEIPKEDFGFYGGRSDYHMESKFGLSEQAEHFSSTRESPSSSSFFYALFRKNFWKGLRWAMKFINYATAQYQKNKPDYCFNYPVKFIDTNNEKGFVGFAGMWVATSLDYQLPRVLSDLLFCLQDSILYFVKAIKQDEAVVFANRVRDYIFTNSNNIALLSIIANIGIQNQKELPGFALDLTTNINFIHHEIERKVHTMAMPLRHSLEKQMMEKVCVSGIENRYENKDYCTDTLQEYMFNAQIYGSKEIVDKCHKILDYLYAQIPNDKNNATEHLQIQKMDARNARVVKVDDTTFAVMANLTGEAEKVVNKNAAKEKPLNLISKSINDLMAEYKDKFPPAEKCVEIIENILKTREKLSLKMMFDKQMITLIGIALNDNKLPKNLREKYCEILLTGINSHLENSFGLLFEAKDSVFLFSQLTSNISEELKNRIKLAMLGCLIFRGQNGIVFEMARLVSNCLKNNQELCKQFFYTIVKLAEDEMNHQKFNAEYVVKNKKAKNFEFVPNKAPKFRGVDAWIEEAIAAGKEEDQYLSNKEEIITKFLYSAKCLDLSNFDIEKYDIRLMCYAFGCGISTDDKVINSVAEKVLITMIDIWKTQLRDSHEILDVYTLGKIEEFFSNELVKTEASSKDVLDIMFHNVAFSEFTHKAIDFYQNVFFEITLLYFDAHSKPEERSFLVSVLENLAKKIAFITDKSAKHQLSKSLAFYFPNYKSYSFSKCKAGYSLDDKTYINSQLNKYGTTDIEDVLWTVRQFHIDKLLPEILLSVCAIFKRAKEANAERFGGDLIRKDYIKETVLLLISKAFIDNSETIKQSNELTVALETILSILCEYNFEEAAVILDEFRIH